MNKPNAVDFESRLNDAFGAENLRLYSVVHHPDWNFKPTWFPDIRQVNEATDGVTLRFGLASNSDLNDIELEAIGNVLGGKAEITQNAEGGCNSCGYGASTEIWVQGGKLEHADTFMGLGTNT